MKSITFCEWLFIGLIIGGIIGHYCIKPVSLGDSPFCIGAVFGFIMSSIIQIIYILIKWYFGPNNNTDDEK
jgi:NAD/NADP transhydrogenase beta subunit